MRSILIALALITQAWAAPPDLLLHLPLDGNDKDASSYRRRTLQHDVRPAPDRFGNDAGACEFQEGSFIQIPDEKDFNHLKAFTLTAWICPNTLREHLNVISKVTPHRDFNLQISALGQLVSHITHGKYEFCYSERRLKANEWTFVAATYEDEGRRWKVYLNGKLDNQVKVENRPAWESKLLTVGNIYPNGPEAFLGRLDDVRVYNRALSDQEIAALKEQKP